MRQAGRFCESTVASATDVGSVNPHSCAFRYHSRNFTMGLESVMTPRLVRGSKMSQLVSMPILEPLRCISHFALWSIVARSVNSAVFCMHLGYRGQPGVFWQEFQLRARFIRYGDMFPMVLILNTFFVGLRCSARLFELDGLRVRRHWCLVFGLPQSETQLLLLGCSFPLVCGF